MYRIDFAIEVPYFASPRWLRIAIEVDDATNDGAQVTKDGSNIATEYGPIPYTRPILKGHVANGGLWARCNRLDLCWDSCRCMGR